MKKLSKWFMVSLIALLCAVTFAACGGGGDNTPKPVKLGAVTNVTLDGDRAIQWTAVPNASGYTVVLSGAVTVNTTTTEASYTITSAPVTGGNVNYSVKANGDGTNYTDSDAATGSITLPDLTARPRPR